ncbi:MAG TPA: o-succinylbenzoate synthase [Bryobacteraceae bacterium]|nr:o-succinylbenzoate synthase [Bryobacteraceae bacterium]
MALRIDQIRIHQIAMPLVRPFETSFGRTVERQIILVEAVGDGVSGWGEVTAGEHPFYNEEWTESAWLILTHYAGPAVLRGVPLFSRIRGHQMACGGLEAAMWDLEARLLGQPLWQHIGGTRTEISCGVSIGIQESVPALIETIERELACGYQRIKMKIKPGRGVEPDWDVDVVREVRRAFPNIRLMVDANSAYTLADADRLSALDDFYLMMIEQPLAHDDIVDHAALQAKLSTPVCLDESIRTARHAEQAIRMGAAQIINIKLGRVGGFAGARAVHDVALAAGIPVWCGGMLESGVGRAHNIALSTLEGFVLPGDVSASRRYWARDVIVPPIEVTPRGTIVVSGEPGFGYALDLDYLRAITVRQETLR